MIELLSDSVKAYNKSVEYRAAFDLIAPQLIDWFFYQPYTTKEPPFSQIGLAVYLRTYSRYIPQLKRREKWCETVLRVVEYSLSLDTVTPVEEKREEALELFDAAFNLLVFSAGRTYWIGGTEAALKYPDANFNCTFNEINSLSSIVGGFYRLLVGSGFGFSVEEKYVGKLPDISRYMEIEHLPFDDRGWKKGNDTTTIYLDVDKKHVELTLSALLMSDEKFNEFLIEQMTFRNTSFILSVGDSKEGWCTALKFLLWCYTANSQVECVAISYDNIRPKGTPLKTFGGRASGHEALQEFFERIEQIINEGANDRLSSIQVLDICNAMGAAVVVGGVRRSSEIALGDINDTAFISAKKNLYGDESLANKRAYRTMSNNSVVLYENPGLDWFREIMESIKTNGEPGFVSLGNANRRTKEHCEKHKLTFYERKGVNPCAEILLGSVCNLTEVNVAAHVFYDETGYPAIDWKLLEKSVRLATRVGSRMTLVTLSHPEWDKVQKRERLLGVSLTGLMTAFDKFNGDFAFSNSGLETLSVRLQEVVNVESFAYHDHLGIPRPLLATCIKPSGTLSLLPGVSPGIHRDYAPYYFRRVRVSKTDPIAHALRSLGIPCAPENMQGDDLDAEQCKTWVFTFPIKTNAPIRSIDEPAIEQLDRYKTSMRHWTQHNTSVTISVDENEWDSVAQWLYENYDDFVGVSFLPKFDSHNSPYPQLPMESCDREKYEELAAKMPILSEDAFIELIASKEVFYEDYELDSGCASGACPVR